MAKTKIEWADKVWNPVVGCLAASEGCRNCYAERLHEMRHQAYLDGKKVPAQYAKTFTEVQCLEDRLDDPLRWKKPARDMAASILGMNQGAHGITTFYGPYGSGKTHLLKAIVNGLRGVGLWSLYANLSDLLSDIRGRFGEPNGQREVANVIDFYRSIRVLCLDEFDRVNLTGWTLETIFRLVDDRYSRMDKLLTVFASNSSLADLPAEFGYLVSRLKQGNVIHVPGPDMRPAVKEIEHWTDRI